MEAEAVTRHIPHPDQRLARVAVDMGLLAPGQVTEITRQITMQNAAAGSAGATFADIAVKFGYLSVRKMEAVRQEEFRRRRLIEGFEIIDLLGAGLISTVYLARQLSMERHVALKVLHPTLAADPDFARNYIEEARAVSRFHHPHIVQGFDAGESNGFYYFSHEYLSGGSMADKLASPGGADFSEARLLALLRQVASALKHAWAVAVYHGDINPGNLLLDAQGNIKLANLGVPRMARLPDSGADSDLGGQAPGSVRSGPEYAAPEQLESPEIVDARTDMYNLGATFYHLSFGVLPFPGPTRDAVREFRRQNPWPAFSLKRQEKFSGKYLRLLHDMLDADPAKRPADPDVLAGRLEAFHLPDVDELTRQVWRESAPRRGTRVLDRRPVELPPAGNSGGRTFSLLPRRETARLEGGRRGRRLWLYAAAAAVAAAVAAHALL